MSDDEGFVLDRRHPASRRRAILDVNGRCAWLYLTLPDNMRIDREAFVFSPGLLVTLDEAFGAAKASQPPPLAADYASACAVIVDARREHFAFRWSDDGQSVAVLYQGDPIAMIIADTDHGFSRALGRSGFYGYPWNSDVYVDTFGP